MHGRAGAAVRAGRSGRCCRRCRTCWRWLAGAHGAVARALLQAGSDDRLRAELVEVSRSRARLVDAFEAERRRIERDLHDGAQQRLVSLTLQLGLARLDLPADSPAAGPWPPPTSRPSS